MWQTLSIWKSLSLFGIQSNWHSQNADPCVELCREVWLGSKHNENISREFEGDNRRVESSRELLWVENALSWTWDSKAVVYGNWELKHDETSWIRSYKFNWCATIWIYVENGDTLGVAR